MEKVFEDMMKYLATATKEQLQKDYEQIKEYNECGPLMEDFLKAAISSKNK